MKVTTDGFTVVQIPTNS